MSARTCVGGSRPYNVIVGHLLGLDAGFFSLWILAAWSAPTVASAGFVASPRLWAAVLSVAITVGLTIGLKATQPAALTTSLLVALGSMQKGRDAIAIVLGVLILDAIGEPLRRLSHRIHAAEKERSRLSIVE